MRKQTETHYQIYDTTHSGYNQGLSELTTTLKQSHHMNKSKYEIFQAQKKHFHNCQGTQFRAIYTHTSSPKKGLRTSQQTKLQQSSIRSPLCIDTVWALWKHRFRPLPVWQPQIRVSLKVYHPLKPRNNASNILSLETCMFGVPSSAFKRNTVSSVHYDLFELGFRCRPRNSTEFRHLRKMRLQRDSSVFVRVIIFKYSCFWNANRKPSYWRRRRLHPGAYKTHTWSKNNLGLPQHSILLYLNAYHCRCYLPNFNILGDIKMEVERLHCETEANYVYPLRCFCLRFYRGSHPQTITHFCLRDGLKRIRGKLGRKVIEDSDKVPSLHPLGKRSGFDKVTFFQMFFYIM